MTAPAESSLALFLLNAYEDMAARGNDPDLVFRIMEFKQHLGLPVCR